MGESVAEATITSWLKQVGDSIEAEESLVEIATDKVDSEVPAPADGVVLKILVEEGQVAKVGDVIAIIGAEGDAPASSNGSAGEAAPAEVAAPAPAVQEAVAVAEQSCRDCCSCCRSPGRRFSFLFASGTQHCSYRRHLHDRTWKPFLARVKMAG